MSVPEDAAVRVQGKDGSQLRVLRNVSGVAELTISDAPDPATQQRTVRMVGTPDQVKATTTKKKKERPNGKGSTRN
jgi:hypothetical protein